MTKTIEHQVLIDVIGFVSLLSEGDLVVILNLVKKICSD